MVCTETPGARRAQQLLYTVPDRFESFCHFDQKSFFNLSDWIVDNVAAEYPIDISVEESLFVFLDIVAQGNNFRHVAYEWDHDIQSTHKIFHNVLKALTVLRESKDIAETCPTVKQTRSRWKIARGWRPGRTSLGGMVRVGYDEMSRDGLEVNQDNLKEALLALNNFIHESVEYDE